jgi:hypothetical protein
VAATNRREIAIRGARGGGLDLAADRFQAGRVTATGELGEHALQRQLAQKVGGGEHLVGRHGQLPAAVGGPDPPAAAGHLAGLAAVAHRHPVRVVAALGADQSSDVLGHQRLQHLQDRPNGQRQQPSRAAPASSATARVTCSGSSSSA